MEKTLQELIEEHKVEPIGLATRVEDSQQSQEQEDASS